jgi:hypothetical protein
MDFGGEKLQCGEARETVLDPSFQLMKIELIFCIVLCKDCKAPKIASIQTEQICNAYSQTTICAGF